MSGLLKTNRRLALGAAVLIIASGMLGYSAAKARGEAGPGHADRKQLAAITAERDCALAALADARMRHRIAQKGIARLVEELTYVDQLNARLQQEKESRPAAGRGGLSTAGPLP